MPSNPPPTCDIFVSWSGNTIGKPWKRDLGMLRYDAAPLSTADVGIAPASMRAGDRFQMELWSGVPGAPGTVMLDKAQEIRGVPLDSANPGAIAVPDADPIPNQEDLGTHVATVGAVPGGADVSGGAASHTAPIAVLSGRSGMQPSVPLSDSSRGGNGVAGLGWSLGAGSRIHRCRRTQAQDCVIVNGNLRYVAGRVLDGEPPTTPHRMPLSEGAPRPVQQTIIDSVDWGGHQGSSEQVLAPPLLYSASDLHNPAKRLVRRHSAGPARPVGRSE